MEKHGFQFPASRHRIADADIAARVAAAMRVCLSDVLGRSDSDVALLISEELERVIPKNVVRHLTDCGIELTGKRVLDLGAGLGGLSEELALHDASVVAIEPGLHWGQLARDRLGPYPNVAVVHGIGEHLPFRDDSFDAIVSLQVLEHVEDPATVLREAFRVCRPGGTFFLSCENYLSFREAHYVVGWLPLLPKRIGRVYLRLRGRSPEFLDNSITYTTLPGVLRDLRKAGFVLRSESAIARKVDEPESFVRKPARLLVGLLKRLLPHSILVRILVMLKTLTRLFTNVVYELCDKPMPPTASSAARPLARTTAMPPAAPVGS